MEAIRCPGMGRPPRPLSTIGPATPPRRHPPRTPGPRSDGRNGRKGAARSPRPPSPRNGRSRARSPPQRRDPRGSRCSSRNLPCILSMRRWPNDSPRVNWSRYGRTALGLTVTAARIMGRSGLDQSTCDDLAVAILSLLHHDAVAERFLDVLDMGDDQDLAELSLQR